MTLNFLNHSRKKYLLLLPIVILLLNSFYFQYATKHIEDTILREKFLETINHVTMLTSAVEANASRFWEDHERNIVDSVEFLDFLPMTFAAVYKPMNGKLTLISKRDYESGFDPLVYEEFMTAVSSLDSGNIQVDYTDENGIPYHMYLHFTYTPMYSPPEERYLIATGVSKYSVVSSVPTWVSAGQWTSMLITFFLNMWLIILVARLGMIHEQREDEK